MVRSLLLVGVFFFKQKTAYEMRISDWSSDVCSSDLVIGSAENTREVWDGFLPFVMATPNAIPSMFTVRMHALRILKKRNRFPSIVDAIDPGGSGDPYAELNDEERAALSEVTRMG